MYVGQKIKQFIYEKGLTQSHISNKTGISLSKLNRALNGHRKMTFEEYELICDVLNVNTEKFLEPKVPEEKATEANKCLEFIIT